MTKLHAHITPGDYSWIGVSAGYPGINYNYTVTQNGRATELYIDRGRGAEEQNQQLFDQLLEHREHIEVAFGAPLSWEALEGKRACRVKYALADGGYRSSPDVWPDLQTSQIDAMIRLERAFKPHIRNLRALTG
jgi:hypothetical protein